MTMHEARQVPLSQMAMAVSAPSCTVGGPDGDIGHTAIEGLYCDDRRALSRVLLRVAGAPVQPAGWASRAPDTMEFAGLASAAAGGTTTAGVVMDDPVWVRRVRTVRPTGMREYVELHCASPEAVRTHCELVLACDGLGMFEARTGQRGRAITPTAEDEAVAWTLPDGVLRARPTSPAMVTVSDGEATFTWDVTLTPGQPWCAEVQAQWIPAYGTGAHPGHNAQAGSPSVTNAPQHPLSNVDSRLTDVALIEAADARITTLVRRSLADLSALTRRDGTEHYVCAGVPWYLTLFGRDSLWAARMVAPIDVGLTMGTLRALAARQGTRQNPTTGEEPGKILHELRREETRGALPALYFGTVDATPLWIITLHEAWRWGAPPGQVAALIPTLERAFSWLEAYADGDEDGLVDYPSADAPDALANQGWKDSADSVHNRAGRLARGRVALAEVQGYAHQAALAAAELFDAAAAGLLPRLTTPGASELAARARGYALQLRERFRNAFWVDTALGRYPALALVHSDQGETWLADSCGSNMAHLLGTGILNAAEAGEVARVLADPSMNSGFGLRTLAAGSVRYHPLSYHNGSVWPHDTAIAVKGLVAEGHAEAAHALAQGIVAAATFFDDRLPELWGGEHLGGPTGSRPHPMPYPTACAPQAWAAASAIALVTAALGIEPDIPHGRVVLRPPTQALLGACTITVRVGHHKLTAAIDAAGHLTVTRAPEGIEVVVDQGARLTERPLAELR